MILAHTGRLHLREGPAPRPSPDPALPPPGRGTLLSLFSAWRLDLRRDALGVRARCHPPAF